MQFAIEPLGKRLLDDAVFFRIKEQLLISLRIFHISLLCGCVKDTGKNTSLINLPIIAFCSFFDFCIMAHFCIKSIHHNAVSICEVTKEFFVDSGNDLIERTMQRQVSELQHSVKGLSVSVQEQFAGGINYIKNSAGLNGVTDDWTPTGVVTTDNSTDVQRNTTSDSCFVLGDTSALMQTVTGVVPGAYTVSVRAKKTGSDYTAYFRVQYNGNKYAYLFNTTEIFGWTEYSAVIDDVQDETVILYAYNRLANIYLSDIILAEGNSVHKWMPAPNEIYTTEVKIDRRGIEVSNNESAQRTVINNTEFSGYYNEEKKFTLNQDETQTKKTTVDGELTVGKTKFVPMPKASEGLNIVILD